MKHRHPKGIGIALLMTLIVMSGKPAMAWTQQYNDARQTYVPSVKDKWPPRSNQAAAGARQPRPQQCDQTVEKKPTSDKRTNPWAHKPPRTINSDVTGKRPWGNLPPTAESKATTRSNVRSRSPRYLTNRGAYPGNPYPTPAYPPYYDSQRAGQYPGYGRYEYPNTYSPRGNSGFFGNSFPMNNFPFSFW